MINRELIRTKVVQLTYAYYQNGNSDLTKVGAELDTSLDKAYDLYNTLLDLIVAVTRVARGRVAVAVARQARGEQDDAMALSERFARNRFAAQLEENVTLAEWREKQLQTWDDDIKTVRRVLDAIVQSDVYRDYMLADAEPTWDDDRELWRRLYKLFIADNEVLDRLFEEKSIYWNDDKGIVDTFVLKTIKRFDAKNGPEQPLLPQYKDEEDRDFAHKLFETTIYNAKLYQQYISEASTNWDFNRLAYMDLVIMLIAIAEMLTFPAIPVNITINEYVGLARTYSTPKSWRYVNGMLDAIARHLSAEGIMLKPVPERR